MRELRVPISRALSRKDVVEGGISQLKDAVSKRLLPAFPRSFKRVNLRSLNACRKNLNLLQDVVIISLSCNTFNSLLSYLSSCQIDVFVSSTVKALAAGSRNGQDCWIARYIAINMFQGPSATDY